MAELACQYPNAKTIHLVMDNLSSIPRKSLTDLYGEAFGGEIWDRFTVPYTPKHGSWLNQAEIEIGLFTRQCLGKRRIPDLTTLRRESRAWNRRMNRDFIALCHVGARSVRSLRTNSLRCRSEASSKSSR